MKTLEFNSIAEEFYYRYCCDFDKKFDERTFYDTLNQLIISFFYNKTFNKGGPAQINLKYVCMMILFADTINMDIDYILHIYHKKKISKPITNNYNITQDLRSLFEFIPSKEMKEIKIKVAVILKLYSKEK